MDERDGLLKRPFITGDGCTCNLRLEDDYYCIIRTLSESVYVEPVHMSVRLSHMDNGVRVKLCNSCVCKKKREQERNTTKSECVVG